ncbi:type II and III secretion system protein family protein [Parasulfuritortus cantonensis]|uniref:Type II and III secretion system protein family protein n=1 Tax=Parasulfuritortus cantonensis TaxID=2528202 RepID=A0A4R1BL49_9PROT|nr:type II and III secretion system protein family protein [Parasulfuritortus cantonensis]TCJ17978.1 type II and III secretion system protein family protein [Parasulfuritortus cantonensis]
MTTDMKKRLGRVSNATVARIVLLATLLLPIGLVPVRAEPPAQIYQVEAGSQLAVKLDKAAQRVAVGDEQIAEIKMLSKQDILVQGIKPGATSLLVWDKAGKLPSYYTIQVNKPAESAQLDEFPGLRLKSSGDLLLLEGTAPGMVEHEKAKQIALHADGEGKGPVQDASKMPYAGEVQIDVRVVELSRSVLKEAGLDLFSTASAITFGTFTPGSLTKVTASAGSGISVETSANPVSSAFTLLLGSPSGDVIGLLGMLEGNGFARTLAQPSLLAQSGQTASFLAGGEFPVPVPQALGQTTIQYKPYGIRLDVAPTVLAENRIALKIAPEVSDLDFDNSIAINGVTVPSLLTRRADTSIELGNGESYVIGGLVSQRVVKSLDKFPGLGDIPVLGAFFKHASLSRDDKELLIIVTPKLVRPLAANAQLGPLPGADLANYNPSLWRMLLQSDQEEAARFTGLSK